MEGLLLYPDDIEKTEKNVQSMLADSENLTLEAVNKFEVRPNLGGQIEGTYVPALVLKEGQKRTAVMIGLILGTPEFQRR